MKESRVKTIARYLRAYNEESFRVISEMIRREEKLRVSENELSVHWSMMAMGINKR